MRSPVLLLAIAALLAGCATPPAPGTATLSLSCPRLAGVPNADYVGPYRGVENVIPLQDLAQDLHCADAFKAAHFPGGFVAIYGSSRIREGDALYADVRAFAAAWTRRFGPRYPIMTGAGPGLMEAGNRGAHEAGGPSVGYTTYYDRGTGTDPLRPYGGDAKQALNRYVTRGLIFSSVAIREQAMIKHSAAVVISPGGTGTEWEAFQIIETIKSRQLAPVPVYVLGNRALHWRSFEQRLDDMIARGTVRRDEVAFLKYVENGEDLARQLASDLRLP